MATRLDPMVLEIEDSYYDALLLTPSGEEEEPQYYFSHKEAVMPKALVSIQQTHNINSKGRDGKSYPYHETIKIEMEIEYSREAVAATIKEFNDSIFNARMEKFKSIKDAGTFTGKQVASASGGDDTWPGF